MYEIRRRQMQPSHAPRLCKHRPFAVKADLCFHVLCSRISLIYQGFYEQANWFPKDPQPRCSSSTAMGRRTRLLPARGNLQGSGQICTNTYTCYSYESTPTCLHNYTVLVRRTWPKYDTDQTRRRGARRRLKTSWKRWIRRHYNAI